MTLCYPPIEIKDPNDDTFIIQLINNANNLKKYRNQYRILRHNHNWSKYPRNRHRKKEETQKSNQIQVVNKVEMNLIMESSAAMHLIIKQVAKCLFLNLIYICNFEIFTKKTPFINLLITK